MARSLGPTWVSSRWEQSDLLLRAGFKEIRVIDATHELGETARAWHDHAAALEHELRPTVGDALFEEQQEGRSSLARGVELGLLSRGLFTSSAASGSAR
jgi:hypothetical protein